MTVDHKRLGIMYLATILSFFLIGGSFAMLVRYELLDAAPTLSASNYNKAFTLHGAIMVFLVLGTSDSCFTWKLPDSIDAWCQRCGISKAESSIVPHLPVWCILLR